MENDPPPDVFFVDRQAAGFLLCGRHSNDFSNQLNKIKILSALILHHFDVLSDNGMITGPLFFPRLSATGHFAAVHHFKGDSGDVRLCENAQISV
jgi:hypothetical protein